MPADGQTQVSLLLSDVGVLKRNNAIKQQLSLECKTEMDALLSV